VTAYFAVTALTGLLTGLSRFCQRPSAAAQRTTGRTNAWHYFDFLAVAGLVAFSALRFQVGTDWPMYYRLYTSLDTRSWWQQITTSPQETGYTALGLALRSISDSPYLIFWAAAVLTVVPVYAAIKRHSADPTLSVLLYVLLAFYVAPFNILRQGIAMSLNFWADTYIEKDRRKWAAINALAGTFHASGWLAALIQYVVRRRRPLLGLLVTLVGSGVAVLALLPHGGVLGSLLDTLNPRYETYIGAKAAGLGSYLNIAVMLALVMFLGMVGWNPGNDRRHLTYAIVGLFFLIVGLNSVVLARMELYFGLFLVLLLPNRLAAQRPHVTKHIVLAAAAVYFAFYVQNFSALLPYQTYLHLSW
jgi:EpsG family